MPKSSRSDYNFFDYNVDLTHRVLWLGSMSSGNDGESGVDAHLAENVIKSIYLLDKLAPNGDKPINIMLNNPGGDTMHCVAIYDAIKHAKSETIITVYGMAMSAGSIILQAATKRIISPSSWLMIHYGMLGGTGNAKDFYKWSDHGKSMDRWSEEIYLKRIQEKNPGFRLKQLQKMLSVDTFLSAQDTVDLGLADEVLES